MTERKKILIIRLSSIGDIILTTPVIRALAQQSDFEIHTLTKHQNKQFYENNPHISMVYSFKSSLKEIIPSLKKEKYFHVIDLHKNFRSYIVRFNLQVKSTTFPKLTLEKFLLTRFKKNNLPNIHIVERYFKAVETLGIKNDGKGLEYYIPAKDEMAPELIDHRLHGGYIAFVIGGQHTTKILPPEKAAEIIEKINMPVVLLGGKEDISRGKEIVELLNNKMKVINTCGEYNFNQSASLVQLSEAVITNDTGLMHVAAAFQKPTISIWGNTVPEFGMYPYMPENKSLYKIHEVKNLKCRPCSKIGYNSCPKKHFDCMLKQDTGLILKSVNELINR